MVDIFIDITSIVLSTHTIENYQVHYQQKQLHNIVWNLQKNSNKSTCISKLRNYLGALVFDGPARSTITSYSCLPFCRSKIRIIATFKNNFRISISCSNIYLSANLETYKNYWEKVNLSFWFCLCLLKIHQDWEIWPPKFPVHKC